MALAVSVRYDFTDDKGKRSSTKIRVPVGLAINDYITFVQSMAQLLANVTQGRITRAGFCVGLDLGAAVIKSAPSLLSEVGKKILFGFSTDTAGFRTRVKVPALLESLVVGGSDAIDQTDTDVAAFITAMEDGITVTGGTIQPIDFRDNDVVALDYARELFRRK